VDPITVSAIIGGLGGLFGGIGKSSSEKKALKEQRREFDLDYGLRSNQDRRAQGAYDTSMASTKASSPTRQALVNALLSRFGIQGANLQLPAPTQPSQPQAPITSSQQITGPMGNVQSALNDPARRAQIHAIGARLRGMF